MPPVTSPTSQQANRNRTRSQPPETNINFNGSGSDDPDLSLLDGSPCILQMTTWLGLSALASLFWIAAAYHYSGVVAAGWAITIPGVLVAQVILFRVILVCRRSSSVRAQLEPGLMSGKKDAGPDLSQLPAVSYLYVLGSGGHTTEMIAIIKQSFKANKNQHRRYIITDGDTHSLNQSKALENLIRASCPDDAGTHDTLMVTRARAVHQSFITSVFTSAKSALDIIAALTAVPSQRRYGPDSALFKWPHVIVTNGPGTGFIVGLVAFALKVVCRVPKDRLKVVFVETWARDNKLGLTGKLFNMTGIADLFVVQSPLLAKAVGKPNIGNINFRYAQLPRPGPTASNDKME